jgi:hypothetical protein
MALLYISFWFPDVNIYIVRGEPRVPKVRCQFIDTIYIVYITY